MARSLAAGEAGQAQRLSGVTADFAAAVARADLSQGPVRTFSLRREWASG
jgi:hypothetical protein